MKLKELVLEYNSEFDYDSYDPAEEHDYSTDEDVKEFFRGEYISVYDALEGFLSDEQFDMIADAVKDIEGVYIPKSAVENVAQLAKGNQIQQLMEFLSANAVSFEEWVNSDDGQGMIKDYQIQVGP